MVVFSGTPCQIEGLCSFLGKRYDNLVLVDLVCHAVSSPLAWKKFWDCLPDGALKAVSYTHLDVYKRQDHPQFRFVKADICDRDAIFQVFEEEHPDIVVNFAAESHVDRSIEDPGIFLDVYKRQIL